ncbi:MAG TPA: putative lipopolysaccharide heptosyltransferase III [Candidatus Manganitrophaceae bacterium]|nr:putative lipopolysaccharide heptosyltransferase III [Candidatus Manganitrophaceae bacterium]
MLEGIERILVIKLRQIGDVLLTVPALRAVREHYPNAHIAVMVSAGTEAMLTGNRLIDEVIVFDRSVVNDALFGRIRRELSFAFDLRKKRFDLAIDLTSGDRAAILSFFSGARYRVGADPLGKGFLGKKFLYTHCRPIRNSRAHTVEQNLEVVRQIGIDTSDRSLSMAIPEEAQQAVQALFARHRVADPALKVHLHPTSRWLFKCWRDEAAAALIDLLSEQYRAQVLLTCGPGRAEKEKARRIFDLSRLKPVDLIGKTSLKELAAISKRSDLFIGVDSAPMHIAAAVGTPVVALFGPSGEHHWRPWGEGHTVVAKAMPCRPCGQAGCNNSKRSECLETLSVEEVWEAVRKQLEARADGGSDRVTRSVPSSL